MFVVPRRGPAAIGHLRGLIESGDFKPVVDRQYPLDQVVEAYRHVYTARRSATS